MACQTRLYFICELFLYSGFLLRIYYLANMVISSSLHDRSTKIENSSSFPVKSSEYWLQKNHIMILVGGVVALGIIVGVSMAFVADAPPEDENGNDIDNNDVIGAPPTTVTLSPFTQTLPIDDNQLPELYDDALAAEQVASGFSLATSMAFIRDEAILVLEKNTGFVHLASFEDSSIETILELDVATGAEQGLLGVAVADMSEIEGSDSDEILVFLFLTEADEDGSLSGHSIYRYEWDGEGRALVNPTLIVELPAAPGPTHNGGKLAVSNEGHLYAIIGDLNRAAGPLQNQANGDIDDTSIIVRVDFDGNPIEDNPFYGHEDERVHKYFAYGIRNSFGMAVDPLTGTLWITENGHDEYDEINVVPPGFNSGWSQLMGPMERSQVTVDDLFMLDGAEYRDPVFSWRPQIGVTDIAFFDSDELGERYSDNIFVGDYNGGGLYFFTVDESRTGLDLSEHSELADGVAETYGDGFLARVAVFPGGITHLETGPDGLLYVLTFSGNIHRIIPAG